MLGPVIGDALGASLLAELRGEDALCVLEQDDGYVEIESPKKYFTSFDSWIQLEKDLAKCVKGEVLDIGCGAGRHALYFQEQGFSVTGIDRSPGAIEICRKRGLRDAKLLSVSEIEKLQPRRFDTVIMFWHNLGLFGSHEGGRELLKKLHDLTTPEALILGTSNSPAFVDSIDTSYHEFNRRRNCMVGQVRMRIRWRKIATDWYDYLFMSQPELREIVNGTGWNIQKIIDTPEGTYGVILTKS